MIQINPSTLQCSLLAIPSSHNEINDTTKTFTFDGVYDQNSTTEQIYTDFGYPLVEVRMDLIRKRILNKFLNEFAFDD